MMYSSVRSINARPKPVSKRILEDQLVFMHVCLLVRIVEIEEEIRDVSAWRSIFCRIGGGMMGDVETCRLEQILTFAPRMHDAKSQREEGVLCNRPF